MVIVPGTVFSIENPRNVGDKQVIKLTLAQKEEGFLPAIINLEVWSDNKMFFDVCKLGEGQLVNVKCNVIAEKKRGVLTGLVKYFPNQLEVV